MEDLLDSAMRACGAHFGAVQLFNPQLDGLEVVAQRGSHDPLLGNVQVMREDKGAVQGVEGGEQLTLVDVELDTELIPDLHAEAQAGYQAMISMPLRTHDGAVLGILATQLGRPHGPAELQLLDLYARYAADLVVRLRYEQALRDAERRKDEFIATLAHELRGPLSPLVNSLAILEQAAGNDERVAKAHTIMSRQVAHLNRLVEDLLDINRVANHKLELRLESVELAQVMRHVEEVCRPFAQRSGQRLDLDLPHEPIRVHADPTRLAQIFINLVTNACKYMHRGQVSLRVRREGAEVEVAVSDTGLGIAQEHLLRIFDLFMQVRPQNSAGGLGLGLPLVKRLVEMHHGTVAAHSEGIGHGSRFVVRLPVMRASAANATREGNSARKTPERAE